MSSHSGDYAASIKWVREFHRANDEKGGGGSSISGIYADFPGRLVYSQAPTSKQQSSYTTEGIGWYHIFSNNCDVFIAGVNVNYDTSGGERQGYGAPLNNGVLITATKTDSSPTLAIYKMNLVAV